MKRFFKSKRSKQISIAVFLILLLVVSFICIKAFSKAEYVSMLELLYNPIKYHNKHIMTEGLWQIDFEDNNLYFNFESRDDMITSPSIWLELSGVSDEEYLKMAELNGRYVRVEGIFNINNTGHLDGSVGAIEKIVSYEAID